MTYIIQPFHFLVVALAGWLNRHQQTVIDYLIEENRVLIVEDFLESTLGSHYCHVLLYS